VHPSPYFDRGSESVRFWVPIGDALIDASVGRVTLHYRYHPGATGDEPLATYTQHAAEIEAAVRQRIAAGAREPVMLRDADLRPGAVR
jgi:hypothetical protein